MSSKAPFRNNSFRLFTTLIMIASLLLAAACSGTTAPTPTPTPTPAKTTAPPSPSPSPSPTPSPKPTHSPSPTGVTQLPAKTRLRVATTTSLYDTGLWSYLEPKFEQKYNVELDVLSAGSGIALEYGRRGDVAVITVHSKADEEKFIADGYGIKRNIFAYNYFIVVGPPDDPAGIKGLTPEAGFKKLAESKTYNWVSRGDNSGTHSKEKAIWAAAGFTYEDVRKSGTWYIETGKGMGDTLKMASEKKAYTLTDMGTFLSYKSSLQLAPIIDKGSIMLNVYSAIAVNPAKVTTVTGAQATMAQNLVDFITSAEIQTLIGDYAKQPDGSSLFKPLAGMPEPTE